MKLREIYPDPKYRETVIQVVTELLENCSIVLKRKREQYTKATSFKEKESIYQTLKIYEREYEKETETLSTFLKNSYPRSYESWIDNETLHHMKVIGYRNTIACNIHKIIT